jgi:hypothetical protein
MTTDLVPVRPATVDRFAHAAEILDEQEWPDLDAVAIDLPDWPPLGVPQVLTRNPWTFHVRAAFGISLVTTVGAVVAAVLEQNRLDLAAYAVLASWALVIAVRWVHARYDNTRTLTTEPA